jgi:hypothetical protein
VRLFSMHLFHAGYGLGEHLPYCLLEDLIFEEACNSVIDYLIIEYLGGVGDPSKEPVC